MDEKKVGRAENQRTKIEGQKHLTPKQTAIQSIKFVLFSAGAGIIQFVSFTLLQQLAHLPYWSAYLPAIILSVLFNFTVNRKFTFKSANNVPVAMIKVACFYVVFIPLSTWWGNALTEQAHWHDFLVLAFTMVINFVTEFLYDRFFVFGKSINTNELGIKEREKIEEEKKEQNVQSPNEDKGGCLWGGLGFLIPIIGLILFLVWHNERPNTAKSCGIGALIGFIIWILCIIVSVLASFFVFDSLSSSLMIRLF